MLRLGFCESVNGNVGEIFTETAQRLVRFGCTEPQAYTLAQVITLTEDTTDDAVQNAVCLALVSAKQAVDGVIEVEYLGGQNRGLIREGKL